MIRYMSTCVFLQCSQGKFFPWEDLNGMRGISRDTTSIRNCAGYSFVLTQWGAMSQSMRILREFLSRINDESSSKLKCKEVSLANWSDRIYRPIHAVFLSSSLLKNLSLLNCCFDYSVMPKSHLMEEKSTLPLPSLYLVDMPNRRGGTFRDMLSYIARYFHKEKRFAEVLSSPSSMKLIFESGYLNMYWYYLEKYLKKKQVRELNQGGNMHLHYVCRTRGTSLWVPGRLVRLLSKQKMSLRFQIHTGWQFTQGDEEIRSIFSSYSDINL